MFSSIPSQVDLGALPTLWIIQAPLYILGPLLFGIATFRARVLPRWAGALLILGTVLIPVGAVVPPAYAAEDHDTGGTGDGMAGIRPLFRTASASPGTRTLRGKPPAQPTRSRVSSLEAVWSGQAAIGLLVHSQVKFQNGLKSILDQNQNRRSHLLLIALLGGFAEGLGDPQLYVAGNAAATAANGLADPGLVRVIVVGHLLNAILFVLTAMALYISRQP